MKKRILLFCLVLILLFGAIIAFTVIGLSDPLPEGRTGAEAEALTDRIEKSINLDAWQNNTAAVEFIFTKQDNRHFRDLKRDLVEVQFGEFRVLYNNQDRSKYLAYKAGEKLQGNAAKEAVYEAIKHHTNDLFWLNPYSMLRAPGTTRKMVGSQALLITFQSGGVTPGDSYLIVTDASGRPTRIQMWVQILPLKGMEWSLENWQKMETGAYLNLYNNGLLDIEFKDVRTYARYPGENQDRFEELLPLMK